MRLGPVVTVVASAALLLLLARGAEASTSVPGQTLSSSTTWTLAGSPYVVSGHVFVGGSSAPVLTIEPGVEVQFTSAGSLQIGNWWNPGGLVANGTAAEPILFTSSAATKARGDWNYIHVQAPAGSPPSYLSHATIEYGGRGSRTSLEIVAGSVSLSDVTVRESAWAGVYVDNVNPVLERVTLRDNARWAVYAESDARPTLADVAIRNTSNVPLRVRLDQPLGGVSLEGNAVRRVEHWGVDLYANLTHPVLLDAVTGERHDVVVLSSFTIRNGATWTVPAGTTVRVAENVEILAGDYACCGNLGNRGSIVAEGTQAEPVAFTALSGTSANGWYGLRFYGYQYAGTSVLRNVTVSFSKDDGIELYHYSSATLDNVTLDRNARWGVYAHGGSHFAGRNLVVNASGGDGMRVYDSSPTLSQVTIRQPGGHGFFAQSSGFTLADAVIDRPGASGVYTAGCGMGRLVGATIERPAGYGVFADWSCNGVHLDGVHVESPGNRPWRNRIDARENATFADAGVLDVEYWGADVLSNRTLALRTNESGARLNATLLSSMRVGGRATFTLEPGVNLRVAQNAQIQVGDYSCCGNDNWRGSLVAEGTQADPITITSLTGSASTGWYGLYFYGYQYPGTSVLRNVTLALSKDDSVEVQHYSSLLLDNVTSDRAARHGLYVVQSSPTLRNVQVLRPGVHGALFYSSGASWTGGGVDHSGSSAVYTSGCGMPSLASVALVNASGYGVYADGSCNGVHLRGVDIVNATGRPWRNRIDAVVEDVDVVNGGVKDLEYWGADLASNRTLVRLHHESGDVYRSTILSGFTVRNGATWTVPAGSRVHVAQNVQIQVGDYSCCGNPAGRGSLLAEGTGAEPILFTSLSSNTAQGWHGLYFYGYQYPGTSILRNVTVSLSKDDGIHVDHYGTGLTLDNATLERNARYGLYVQHSSPTLHNSVIRHSGSHGIYLNYGSHPVMIGVTVEHSGGYGVLSENGARPALYDSIVRNATQRPLRVRIDSPLVNVTLDANGIREVELWGVDLHASLSLGPRYDVSDGARYAMALLSSFTVRNGATLTLLPDLRLLVNENVEIRIGDWSCCGDTSGRGSLVVEGTQAQPVALASRSNNTAQGWHGLYFYGYQYPGTSILRNVTVSLSKDDGIHVDHYGTGLTLDNATLERNARYGLYAVQSSPTLHNSVIRHSGSHGVYLNWGSHPTMAGVTIEHNAGYGVLSENGARAALYDSVVRNATQRPLRVRIDSPLVNVTLDANGIREVEFWGATLSANLSLGPRHDASDGARYDAALLSSFTVRNGATLTLLPDLRLLVNENVEIRIGDWSCCGDTSGRGSLVAEGTAERPVVLTSRSNNTAQGWHGLYFYGYQYPGTSVLRNVTVSLSKDDGIHAEHYGTGLTLDNATLERNARYGLYAVHSSPTLLNSIVRHSGSHGIYLNSGSHPVMIGVTVEHNGGYGVFSENGARASLTRVTLRNATQRPARLRIDSPMNDVAFEANGIQQVEYWGATLHANATLAPHHDAITGQRLDAALLSSFTVRNGATWTILPGARLLVNENVEIRIGDYSCCGDTSGRGNLLAEGVETNRIVITSRSNNTAQGWYGLHLYGNQYAGTAVLRNATVSLSKDDGIFTESYASFTLDNVTLEGNARHGLYAHSSSGATGVLRNTRVVSNGADGVFSYGSRLLLERTNASANAHNGLHVQYGASHLVRDSTFWGNGRAGVNATAGNPALDARRSYFWSNGGFGVDLQGSTGSTIVDNAFIENVVGQARATNANAWNVTKTEGRNIAYGPYLGGNSWSDYAGEDTDGDGLGDTLVPYAANLGPGADHLPVMGNLYADFNVTIPDVANLSRRLAFTDASRGGFSPPDQWVWDFGDGGQSTAENVTHDYAADGNYSVQLTVANPHGQLSQVTKTVVVDSVKPVSSAALAGTAGLDGWFVSGVNATLAATDDRAGVASIQWRLDGGAWAAYAGPIPVLADGAHLLEHYALDRNGNAEPVRNVTFRIDRTAPVLAPPLANGTMGDEGWWVSDLLVTLAADDATSGLARVEYALGAAPNLTYAGPVAFQTDGAFLLRWRAVDNAGNVGPEANLTVRRDATLPGIQGHESGPLGGAGWYLGPVTVDLAASDATSGVRHLNASVDSGPWFEVNGSINVTGHGVHTLNATATDVAGNLLHAPARTVRIDLSTPVSEHHFNGTLGANGWFVSEVNVTFTGNDTGSGIASFVYSLDGGPNTTYAGPVLVAQSGEHRLVYHAVDAAGNAETVHEVILYLDLEAPDTHLNLTGTVGANGWWLSNLSATLEAEDPTNLAQILYRLDGGPETEFLAPFPIAGEGVHNVTWHGVSVSGLVEEDKHALVRVDLTDPSIAVSLNGTEGLDGWRTSAVQAALLVSDAASGIATTFVRADGAAETTYTGPVTFGTTGVHTLAGRTLDVAGRNATLPAVEVRVDLDDPLTTLATTPAAPAGLDGWHTAPVTVNLTAADLGSGVARILVSLNGSAEAPYAGNLTLGEGVHDLAYRAVDVAGRVEALRTARIKVDLTPPALHAAANGTPGNEGWFVSAVNVTADAPDATSGLANLTASVDGGAPFNVTGPIPLGTTGVHAVALRAADAAGLVAHLNLTVKVDVTPPTTTPSLTGAANAFGWRAAAPAVTLSATDPGSGVAAIRYSLDGGPLQDYAGAFSIGEGFHNLTFFAVDVAGLAEALGAPLPVRVDLTNPATDAVGFRAPDHPSGWHLAPLRVNLTGSDAPSGLRDFLWWLNASGPHASGGAIDLSFEGERLLKTAARDFADRLQSPALDTLLRMDLAPPVSTHALSPAATGTNRSVAWRDGNVTFSMASTDAGAGVAARLVSVNGNESPYADALVFADEGVYHLAYHAVDLVDRVETARTVPAFGIDRTPPATTPHVEGAQDVDGVYKTEVNVTLDALDALSGVLGGPTGLQWRFADGSFQAYAGPIHLNVSGNYTIEFQARDVAGNVEPLQALHLDVFVDTSPPVAYANLTGPLGPGGWYGGNVTVHLSATDLQSSVQALLVRVDGGDLLQILGDEANLTLGGEGAHLVEYGALDIAGNLAPLRNVTFSIDVTPPTLGLDAAFTEGRDGWIVSPVNLTPLAADALSGVHHVEASVDGAAWAPIGDVLVLAHSGNHTALLRAVDAAGLLSDLADWSGKLDLDVPALRHAFVGPQGLEGWYRANVSVLLGTSLEDTSGVLPIRYRFDAGEWAEYPGSAIQFSAEGNHTLEALVEDVAGNLARLGPVNVGIDRTPPVLATALEGGRGLAGWWITPVRATTTVDDLPGVAGANVSGVHNLTRVVDGGPNATVPIPATLTLDASGVHEIRDLALDVALNGRAASLAIPLDLDDPLLNLTVEGPAGLRGWFTGPVLVNATSLDPTSGPGPAQLTREGEVHNVTGPLLLEAEGVHALVLRAADLAGRLGDEVPVNVSIDGTPPEIAALAEGPRGADGWFTGVTRVTLDARDLVSGVHEIRYFLDNETPRAYGSAINLTKSGRYVLNYTGIDVAGNALSREMVLHVDVDAPEVNVTLAGVQAANSSWFRSGVTVTLDATDPTSGVAKLEYTFDLNGSWIPYAGPIEVSAEGNHTLWYRAVGGSGLAVVYSHSILIDLTLPIAQIHLENTLYTEIDGKIYVSGELCIEITGIDALSGVRDVFLRLSGAITKLVKIDLEVSLHCFEPEEEGWHLDVFLGVCDLAEHCSGHEMGFDDEGDGGGGGGGAGMAILRPFRGAVNLQHVSFPVFRAAFPEDGVRYDTGVGFEANDVDDPSRTRRYDVIVENPHHAGLASTTIVAGTRVPVWVTGVDFNAQSAELHVDGKLLARSNESKLVKYETLALRAVATPDGQVTHELARTNVTRRLFVFQLDTFNLTAGEHRLLAKGYDRLGRGVAGGSVVHFTSAAVANLTVGAIEDALADKDAPGPLPPGVPRPVRDAAPQDVTPDLPPEARERLDQWLRAARIVAGLVDGLVLDNYAYVDEHLLRFYEAYDSADAAVSDATGRPDPLTVEDVEWGAEAPEPNELIPQEGS